MQSLLLLFWFENKPYQISFPAISLNQIYHFKTRTSGEGNGNPLQYSGLGYPMDRGAWWATVHGVAKELDMTKQLKQQGKCYTNIENTIKGLCK